MFSYFNVSISYIITNSFASSREYFDNSLSATISTGEAFVCPLLKPLKDTKISLNVQVMNFKIHERQLDSRKCIYCNTNLYVSTTVFITQGNI